MQARNATDKYLNTSVKPTDRIAVFTVSGRNQLDFTDDRDKLHATLRNLQVSTVTAGATSTSDCPPMDPYEADLIQNHHDQYAMDVATSDALACSSSPNPSPTGGPTASDILKAQSLVDSMAIRVEQQTSTQTEYTLRRVKEIIERLSVLPGQRNLVLISPGFLYTTHETEYSDLIDRAIRQSVFINTLDARGLYVPDLGTDISQDSNDPNPANAGLRSPMEIDRLKAASPNRLRTSRRIAAGSRFTTTTIWSRVARSRRSAGRVLFSGVRSAKYQIRRPLPHAESHARAQE